MDEWLGVPPNKYIVPHIDVWNTKQLLISWLFPFSCFSDLVNVWKFIIQSCKRGAQRRLA